MKTQFVLFLSLFSLLSTASAKPVEIETPYAHIVVIRPVDRWSGDESSLSNTLNSVRERRCSYFIKTRENKHIRGSPLPFQGMQETPVTIAVKKILDERKTKLVSNDDYYFGVESEITIKPDEYQSLVTAQKELFRQTVISQGNPEAFSRKVKASKILGGFVSVIATIAPMGRYGDAGAYFMLNTNLTSEVYQWASTMPNNVAPLQLPSLDLRGVEMIDFRRVSISASKDVVGQIVIAYKKEPTQEEEDDALVKAIVSLTGIDTTPEEIEKSRADDYATRLAIWNTCVKDGKCKEE